MTSASTGGSGGVCTHKVIMKFTDVTKTGCGCGWGTMVVNQSNKVAKLISNNIYIYLEMHNSRSKIINYLPFA